MNKYKQKLFTAGISHRHRWKRDPLQPALRHRLELVIFVDVLIAIPAKYLGTIAFEEAYRHHLGERKYE
jgi:hypothetical protein